MKTLSVALAAAWAVAVSPAAAQGAPAERIAAGRQVFELHCVACHGAGPGVPPFDELAGTGALRTKYRGEKPAVLAERTDLTRVRRVLRATRHLCHALLPEDGDQ